MNFKIIAVCLLIVLAIESFPVFASASTVQKQAYFTALPDIPLMPAMNEIEEQTFVFDKAEGRVVESVGFLSASTPQKVYAFYEEALKRLGWKPLKNNAFSRNNEQIVLGIEALPQGVQVRFRLSPQPMPLSR